MTEEHVAAYQAASDLYCQMLIDLGRARNSLGSASYRELPTSDQQHRHILQIAEFLTQPPVEVVDL